METDNFPNTYGEDSSACTLHSVQALLNTLPCALLLLQPGQGHLLFANTNGLKLTGYSREEFVSLSSQDFFGLLHPDDRLQLQHALSDLHDPTQPPGKIQFRLQAKDGHWLLCQQQENLVPLPSKNQKADLAPRPVLAFLLTKTEQTSPDYACQDVYAELVENANSAIIRWEIDGTITFINSYALDLFGYNRDECLGRHISMILPERDSLGADMTALVSEIAARPEHYVTNTSENISKDGRHLYITWTNRILYPRDNSMPEILVIGNDLTQLKEIDALSRTNSRLLHLFIDHIPVALAMFDRNMVYLNTSRKWLEDYNLGSQNLIGRSHYEVFPEISSEWKSVHMRGLAGEIIEAEADRFERADGSVQWLYWKVLPWIDQNGNIGGIMIVTEDITRRKAAEEALLESEARYNAFVNATHDLMFVKDDHFRYVTINKATERFFGRSRSQILGCTDQDLMDEQSAYACHLSDLQVRATQAVVIMEESAAGQMYETTKFPLILRNGRFGIGAIIRNVTEHKKAVAALEENELRYRTLANSGQALIWTSGLDKKCDYFNKTWLDFTGKPLEDELGDGWVAGVHPDDLDHCIDTYVTSFDRREPFSMEYRLLHHSGDYRWLQDDGTPRFDSEGNFIGYIGHCLDISERKKTEEEHERLQQELNQAQKMESVGRLAGGVAHDFNNMLGIILGHAELAMDQINPASPVVADLLEIRKAAERSSDLTRQLLTFARKQIISPRILDLNEKVEGLLKMLRRIIGEDIKLSWKPAAELWKLRIDPSQIDQILANLCINARDAIKGVGEILVETDRTTIDEEFCHAYPDHIPGDFVVLIVSDNGSGMDKETLNKLFEPFFTTKELGKGTGLGLATIYGIVRQNKGFITVYTEADRGSTFKIYLPRYRDHQDATHTPELADDPQHTNLNDETILVVEDEPAILNMTTTMLQRHGFSVLGVSSPQQAIALARQYSGTIDLMITDVIMPEMNGRDLAHQLTAFFPQLKILYMSGYTANVIAQHGVLDPGVKFLQKPFSMHTLLTKVRKSLEDPPVH